MATVTWLSHVSYYARPWCIPMIAFLTWVRLEAVTPSTAMPSTATNGTLNERRELPVPVQAY